VSSTLSADAKDALARDVPATAHCRAALRDALLTFGVAPGTGVFRTQRASVARLLWTLLDARTGRTLRKTAGKRLRRLPVYEVAAGEVPPPHKPAARCDRRMALRGAFLACGSLAAPARGYHLEFVPPSDGARDLLIALLRSEGRTPKVALRKSHQVVYFKGIDEIAHVLASIGASNAVLRLEDVRALKETKNRIHRLVNTEAANVERAAGAAAVQREAIAFVADAYGLRNLSAPLREVAELRLSHPTETLAELGRRCNPPAKKSTVNGRLAAILRLGRRLREGTGSATGLKGSANPSR
jgi:DNA-binding transcriptional regulator WhiA